ncbi:MAG: cytochrome-c peroxidase [Planctomycetes bacterium]|nr:cytochrome-c peroxidase [Planctomycetota bacterium]
MNATRLFGRPGFALGALIVAAGLTSGGARQESVPKDTLPAQLAIDHIPLGLEPRTTPKEVPLTEARVKLGRKLFFDPILSSDRAIACASCHKPENGFSGGEAKSTGVKGKRTSRRAPSLLNRAYGNSFFWDGREATLEVQALKPIEDPDEMGSKLDDVIARLRTDKEYSELFKNAFDDGVNSANLGKAIASFERILLRGDSAVDRFRRLGSHDALTPSQRSGLWLYESKGRCWRCHTGANFTDEKFHNTGVSWGKGDLGRFRITGEGADRGKFKTPSLRGVALTAPYMHDGSLKTLEDVVEYYNRGGNSNLHLDPTVGSLGLSKDEVKDLVAFLKAL